MAARALTYGPDGEVTTDDLTGGKAVELSAKPRPTHAYTSREPDPGTGFYHYGPRTYDPSLRRWLSPDPLIGMAPERQALWGEQLNLYSYASNNPARWTDLSGLEGPTVMERARSLVEFAGAALTGVAHGMSPIPVPDPPIAHEKGTAYEKEHVVGFAAGQVVGGLVQAGKGVDMMGKGGEVTVGSGGAATLGGAVVVAAGATMVYSGARSTAAGLVTLYNEARNHGRGGGSASGESRPQAAPEPATTGSAAPSSAPTSAAKGGEQAAPRIDPTKPANEVLPGSLRREFPGQHLGKSLNDIKGALRTAEGADKKSLQTAKKILEQSERLLEKAKSK